MTHLKRQFPELPPAARHAEHDKPVGPLLQAPFIQNVLPWVTSVAVHAALLVIGLLTYTAFTLIHQPKMIEIPPVSGDWSPGAAVPEYKGSGHDALLRPEQNEVADDEHGASFKRASAPAALLEQADKSDSASVIAIGAMSAFGDGGRKGTAHSDIPGNGDGTGLSPYGMSPRIGGSLDPHGLFLPVGARNIVYVCDSSGSMINKMPSLKAELLKAVSRLTPIQSFSIIFFQDQRPQVLSATLLPANPGNKVKAGRFLEGVTATGSTDPIPGIEAAFAEKPQLIFLLTDGDFPDNRAVLERIRVLNADHRVRIDTIAFVGKSDDDTAFIDLLKTISKENGGVYRHVTEEDLGD